MLICNNNADDDGDNDDDDDNACNGYDGKTGFPFLAFSSQVQKESSYTLSRPFRTFILLLYKNNYTYFGILLERFQFIGMYWRESGTSEFYHVTQSVKKWQNTSYLDKKISNEQHLSCKQSSPQSTPILGLPKSTIFAFWLVKKYFSSCTIPNQWNFTSATLKDIRFVFTTVSKIRKEISIKICWQLKTPTQTWKCARCIMQYAYLYTSDFPFKTFCKLAQNAETIRKNVWEKSNDA